MTFVQQTLATGLLVATLGATSLAQAPATPPTATGVFIHAGAVLDRPGQAPRGPSTIVVRDGRIESVRDGHVPPTDGARLVDLKSAFVLPGLVDAHVPCSRTTTRCGPGWRSTTATSRTPC